MSLQQRWSNISKLRNKNPNASDLQNSIGQEELLNPYRAVTRRLLFPAELTDQALETTPRCMLYPESRFKSAWDVLAVALMSMQAVIVPLTVAFEVVPVLWYYADISIQGFFAVDIIFNLNSAYYELGALVTERKKIALHYLKGWLIFDVISTFTPDLFLTATRDFPFVYRFLDMRLVRFCKVLRLVRLVKFNKIFFMLEDISSNQFIASCFLFFRLIFILFISAHWVACGWITMSIYRTSEPDNWIAASEVIDESRPVIYVSAMYWSLTTMVSVGYGDIKPKNTAEIYFALISVVIATFILQYLLGSITAFIIEQSESESQFREACLALNNFMKSKDFSDALRGKVKRYLEFVWERTKNCTLEGSVVLPFLSKPLRNEIFSRTRGVVFKSLGVFETIFYRQVTILSELLKQQIYAPEDIVFTEGEMSSSLYFIQAGVVDVYHMSSNSSYRRLSDNEHFGEVSFFSKMPRTASVKCLCFTELFALERRVMEEVCEESPLAKSHLNIIEVSILDGNLACLGLSCYICSKLGHVAINCKTVLILKDKQQIRENWINNRNKLSKQVDITVSMKRNFLRKQKKAKLPLVRTATRDTFVRRKVREFLRTNSQEKTPTTLPIEHPSYSLILYNDSGTDEDAMSEGAQPIPKYSNFKSHMLIEDEVNEMMFDSEEEEAGLKETRM